jgi:hypothetical protein
MKSALEFCVVRRKEYIILSPASLTQRDEKEMTREGLETTQVVREYLFLYRVLEGWQSKIKSIIYMDIVATW